MASSVTCPACGATNPGDSQFCDQCSAVLTRPAPAGAPPAVETPAPVSQALPGVPPAPPVVSQASPPPPRPAPPAPTEQAVSAPPGPAVGPPPRPVVSPH